MGQRAVRVIAAQRGSQWTRTGHKHVVRCSRRGRNVGPQAQEVKDYSAQVDTAPGLRPGPRHDHHPRDPGQVAGDVVEGDTKTDASARTVSLDAGTVEVLRAHRRRQAELRLLFGGAWVDTGLVFTKADGSALVPDSVSRRFDGLVVRAGLPPVRLHDLRHLAASLT